MKTEGVTVNTVPKHKMTVTIQLQKMGSCQMASSVCLGQGGMAPVLLVNMVSVVTFHHQ